MALKPFKILYKIWEIGVRTSKMPIQDELKKGSET